jgi:hypothetical protein
VFPAMASLKFLLTPIYFSPFCQVGVLEIQGHNFLMLRSHTLMIPSKPEKCLITHRSKLVSTDGRFQIDFFNNGTDGGYLGIWYTNDDYESKVWIANRDKPVRVNSQLNLTLDTHGLLKIVHDGEGSPIPLNANVAAPNSIATLENSGNFIVKELEF